MADSTRLHDVLVVGGGNAALCAAIMARRAGASVLVLECATKDFRGGNSRHTRDIRYLHRAPTDFVTASYEEEEFWSDLLGVTGGATDERLARLTLRESETLGDWMPANGVRWQKPLRGTLHLAKSNLFMLGGGKAMMNAYYDTALKLGVEIAYETGVEEVTMSNREFVSAMARRQGAPKEYAAKTLVVASGGFEANIPWLKEYWGDAADNFIIRGTPHNQGRMLKELLKHGAKPVGDPRGCHAVALDARAPKFDGGIVTRLDSVPFGIVVNKDVKRFYDEGEDFWPKRYAIWGRLVAQQPGQIAWSIIDAKAVGRFMPPVFPGVQADSLPELARRLGLDEAAFMHTLDSYNTACRVGRFDHTTLDDCHTDGLSPAKTHWARPIDTAPFYGYALKPGVTFTYLGLKVDDHAAVHFNGTPSDNLFVAGEMMAGNVLGKGYTAGVGMSIGTAFGRIAGVQAAAAALKERPRAAA